MPSPPPRRAWYAPYGPATGSFVGNDEEDFVGAFREAGAATATLFAVDGAEQRIVWSKDVSGFDDQHGLRLTVIEGLVGWIRQDSQVHVLDAATGAEQRTIDVRGGAVLDRLCPNGTKSPVVLAPQPRGYDSLINLATGDQPNNSGVYPRPACPETPRFQALPAYVAKLLPPDLEPAKEPMYAYEPGRLLAKPRKGRADPILVGLQPSGQPRWRLRLGETEPAPLEVVDIRTRRGDLVVLASRSPSEGVLLGIAPEQGTLRWTAPVACGARSLEVTETRVYVTNGSQQLLVFDRGGKLLATFGDRAPGGCSGGK